MFSNRTRFDPIKYNVGHQQFPLNLETQQLRAFQGSFAKSEDNKLNCASPLVDHLMSGLAFFIHSGGAPDFVVLDLDYPKPQDSQQHLLFRSGRHQPGPYIFPSARWQAGR